MIRLLVPGAIAGAVLVAVAGVVLIVFGASERRLRVATPAPDRPDPVPRPESPGTVAPTLVTSRAEGADLASGRVA